MIAQIDKVSPDFLHQAALLLIGVMGGAASAAAIVGTFLKKRRVVEPQPLEVKEAQEFMRVSDCRTQHRTIEAQLVELRSFRVQDAKDASASRKSIYQEIETIRREMAEMERRLNAADEARTEKVHARINDILEAVGELRGKAQ